MTDQWLVEGGMLKDVGVATDGLALIEAENPRLEATAIALVLRDAAENGASAALISPDRELTRQVTAALDRWRIIPDDSAGRPLQLTAPGRLLRQVATLFGQKLTADRLIALMKHPLVATGSERGEHLLQTRELELWLRRVGAAFIEQSVLTRWAGEDPQNQSWVAWIEACLGRKSQMSNGPLGQWVNNLLRITEALCAGPSSSGAGALWEEPAGEEARRVMDEIAQEAEHGGHMNASEFSALLANVLSAGSVRDSVAAHPNIMIWGTLEARVHGADLVVLAGLNEGTWPAPPRPDPWLNRQLRHRAGMLLPEREIGLSAHDYQQAVCVSRVVLSRSVRDAEAQTVPSRWLSRLTNLLDGLPPEGPAALNGMRARGRRWTDMARLLDVPVEKVEPAKRPAPCPPVHLRPTEISITEVQRLIRDPYAVYARRVLGLSKLDPLVQEPDAPLRGILFHSVFERFLRQPVTGDRAQDEARLLGIADEVLSRDVGWPAARRLWALRIAKLAGWFVETEYLRSEAGKPAALEAVGRLDLPDVDMALVGKIDRIDRLSDGTLAIYDYKTGRVPTGPEQAHFDKQLLLSALMAERGEIAMSDRGKASKIAYIGLGNRPVFDPKLVELGDIEQALHDLKTLLAAYRSAGKGYTSRRAVDRKGHAGDYDHLARYGEWDEGQHPYSEGVN